MWEQLASDPEFKGCLLGSSSVELGRSDDRIARIVDASFTRLERAFARTFARAQSAGELADEVSARDLARLFVSTGQGLATVGRVKQGRRFARGALRALLALLPATS